jgi:hypothetical protein
MVSKLNFDAEEYESDDEENIGFGSNTYYNQ